MEQKLGYNKTYEIKSNTIMQQKEKGNLSSPALASVFARPVPGDRKAQYQACRDQFIGLHLNRQLRYTMKENAVMGYVQKVMI